MNCIVDDIGLIVEAMKVDTELITALTSGVGIVDSSGYAAGMPYYMYGHRLEIANRLLEQDSDKVFKYQKYPLVALRMDIPEANADGMIEFKLNIALIMSTGQNWYAPERYVKVFKPILYPMYRSFLKQLKKSGKFTWEGDQTRPEHTKLDRPYWGVTANEGNTASIFNDPLDAIEMIDLKIRQNIKCGRVFAEEYEYAFE